MKTILTLATGSLFLISSFGTARAAEATFGQDQDGPYVLISMADSTKPDDVLGNDAFQVYQAMKVKPFDGLDGQQIKEINSKDGKFMLDCRLDGDEANAYCAFYLKQSSNLTFDATEGHEKAHYELQANTDTDGLIKGFGDGFTFLSHDHATTVTVNANSLAIDFNADNRCEFGICQADPKPTPPTTQPR